MAKPKEPQTSPKPELNLKEATQHLPTTNRLEHWMKRAFDQTDREQKRYLAQRLGNMTKPEFETLVTDNSDYTNSPISPKELKQFIAKNHNDFHDHVIEARDIEDLYKRCQEYVHIEQVSLFYITNDVLTARLNQDYFNNFVDQLLPSLEADGIANERWKLKFGQLKDTYRLGFESYEIARGEVAEHTNDKALGLLQAAHERISGHFGKTDEGTFQKMLYNTAQDTARDIIDDHFDIPIKGDTAVPPLLFSVAKLAHNLTLQKMEEQYPGIDLRDPKTPEWEKKFDAIYQPMMNGILDSLEDDDSPINFMRQAKSLKREIMKYDHLPDNFSTMVDEAARKAAKTVLSRSKDYALEDRPRTLLKRRDGEIPPRSGKILDAMLPGHDTHEHLASNIREYLGEVAHLSQAYSKKSLIHGLDNLAAFAIDEGTFSFTHPGIFLAAKDFTAEFRRELGKSMHEAKCFDGVLMENIKEIENGIDYAYQTNNAIGDWLMQETQNGTDRLFHHSWMKRGWTPTEMTVAEFKDLKNEGFNTLYKLCEQRGIPEEICGQGLIPLVYERCRDIAEAEYSKAMREPKHYEVGDGSEWQKRVDDKKKKPIEKAPEKAASKKGPPPPKKRVTAKAAQAEPVAVQQPSDYSDAELSSAEIKERLLRRMTVDILKEALERITLPPWPQKRGAPPQEPEPPAFNAHNVGILFDYLNARERKALPPEKRDITLH